MTDNHQEKNARVLSDRGGAVLILESECTSQKLYGTVKSLLADRQRRQQMRSALQKIVVLDSAEQICDTLEELARGKRR